MHTLYLLILLVSFALALVAGIIFANKPRKDIALALFAFAAAAFVLVFLIQTWRQPS